MRTVTPDHEVAIIGAGLGGIGAAIALNRAGVDDYVVLEHASDIGGTWRDNTYPGIAVDIPAQAYQFSFELKPDWSRVFARCAEVKAYIDQCADRYDARPRIRLDSEVLSRDWDENAHLWRLKLPDGELTTRFVIRAVGAFVNPKPAEIAGVEEFEGTVLRSAAWDHSVSLEGKRAAIVGDLRTFNRSNVELVSETIERVTPNGIRTVDGSERPVDVLVLATGFRLATRSRELPREPGSWARRLRSRLVLRIASGALV